MNELIKMMETIEELNIGSHFNISDSITLLKKDDTEIIEIVDKRNKWEQEYTPINKELLIYEDEKGHAKDIWVTYENCRTCELFYYNENKLKIKISIYDGDHYQGFSTTLRFSITLLVNIDSIVDFKSQIENNFDWYLEREYEEYLNHQKEMWINKKRNSILDRY
jgi:hypothetical protein